MKIGFATDTNLLKKQDLHDCKEILDATDIYTEYIKALKNIESRKELIYYMPEIVVEELLMQKENAFNIETFKVLKGVQDALEKQNTERNEKMQAIINSFANMKIPTIADVFREKGGL